MKKRMASLSVLTAMSVLLVVPTAASAHGPCEEAIHHGVEPVAAAAGLGDEVHELEDLCP